MQLRAAAACAQAALATLVAGPGVAHACIQPAKLSQLAGSCLHDALGIKDPKLVQLLRVSRGVMPLRDEAARRRSVLQPMAAASALLADRCCSGRCLACPARQQCAVTLRWLM